MNEAGGGGCGASREPRGRPSRLAFGTLLGVEERERSEVELLPLVLVRDGVAEPLTDRRQFRVGDRVYFAWPYAARVLHGHDHR